MRAKLQVTPIRQSGFSMVELMVALVLGLFLTTAVLQTFISAKETYEFQQELSAIQENGRFAMTFLTKDIRAADFWGCMADGDGSASTSIQSILSGAASSNVFAAGVAGFNKVPAASTGYTAWFGGTAQPDAIVLQGARDSGITVDKVPSTTNPNIHLSSTDGIKKGDILLVSDCSEGVMFQVTDTPNPSDKIILHNQNGGSVNETPGNKQNGLGIIFDDSATVFQAESIRYWIRAGVSGEPALIRGTETDAWTAGDELVEGVENIQFLYGVDLNDDKTANYFVDADVVNAAGDMDKVVSIQVHLVVRSFRDNMVEPTLIDFYGGPKSVNDHRMRKIFVSTIAIRNRLD
ncbi:MAG: PilW family protein [Halopseudomonas sp.]